MTEPHPISISILDKDYKVACPLGEQSALLSAAKYLDGKMREVRDSGGIVGSERIAVITALNVVNELLGLHNNGMSTEAAISPRLKRLESKIDQALKQTRQVEI